MRTIPQIIEASGGAKAIQAESNGAFSVDAVYKWPTIGIPDRHWPLLIKLAGATPEELFKANAVARQETAA